MQKFWLVMVSMLLATLILVRPVLAEDTPWYIPSIGQQNADTYECGKDGGVCLETVTHSQLNNIATAFTCAIGGVGCGTENLVDPNLLGRSLLGMTTQGIALLYIRPPTTTTEYLAYVGDRAGLVPHTYAQGLTFARLSPIFPLWKALRDIAFAALSIVLLFDGFIIMFRGKINPQTVAKIENTIPNIVITMMLITFSMAIAAFIIDLMYVAIAAGIWVLGEAAGMQDITQNIQDYTTGGVWMLGVKVFSLSWPFLKDSYQPMAGGGVGGLAAFAIGSGLTPWSLVLLPITLLAGAWLGGSIGGNDMNIMTLLSPIFILIMLIYLFFLVFRIFFILLSSYIQILISIIFAPILLLQNALPGQDSFGNWWRGLVANCLVFVVTALLLYTGWVINWKIIESTSHAFWAPPFMSFIGSGDSNFSQFIVGLIAIGIAHLIPQVTAGVKQAMKAKPSFQMGPSMIGQPLGATFGKAQEIMQNIHVMKQSGLGDKVGKFLPGPLGDIFKTK